MTDFEKAHAFVRRWEGGYVNHPNDKGGETNLGVTKSNWVRWCQSQGLPIKPMKQLTPADVKPLYEAWYWKPLAAQYPWPVSAALYDCSVNHGPGDGNPFDEGGREAGASWIAWKARQLCPNGTPLQQALAVCDAREAFYAAIIRHDPSQQVFQKGWMNRLNALRTWLKEAAAATPEAAPQVLLVPKGGGEPVPWDGKPAPYGGVPLTAALIEQLRLVYPQPGGPWTYQGLKVYVRRNGDLVLERFKA
ncbi:glycoside hydrolase family 108 protein [Deinococcus hohokamensis]|uniref:Glycoside hydrolase family 108 protein n=1 Tax=Deinococcus hohokamensis TaxID=309883 RepID=A0ABV9I5C6_9DEIO